MKAVIVTEFGGPEQLRLADVPDPVPGPGQVRIAVRAAGVNPVDAGNRTDGSWAGLQTPCILGYDIAGVVESLGPGVEGPLPGQRVMAMTHFPEGAGGYAELAVVDAEQLAARLDLVTFAVGRPAMHEQMRALGASCCIDYTAGDIAEQAIERADGPVDAIAALIAGPHLRAAFGALLPGGQIACIDTSDLGLDPLIDANITFHGVLIDDDGDRTRRLAARLADGSLRPVISHELPLSEAARAHEILETGHAGGKIVLIVPG